MVGGLEAQGSAGGGGLLGDVTGGSRTAEALAILWGAAAGSALVDNIPFTAAMIPVVDELQAGQDSTTPLVGARARGLLRRQRDDRRRRRQRHRERHPRRTGQPLSFTRFLAIGVPVTLVSLAIATVYLLVFQL